MTYIPFVVALVVSTGVITFILQSRFSQSIQDVPNERSLHNKIVPRTGGMGLMSGVLVGWALISEALVWWLIVPLLGMFVVSILDDVYNLSVKKRLFAHLMAAAIFVIGSGVVGQQGAVIAILMFFFVVWMTNLYNFMDGSDGLAGGMAVFGFGSYGLCAWFAQDAVLMSLCVVVAAAALGFLLFNFHPAKIFMGDAGSIPLGFLAAALGIWGWQRGDWPYWLPLLVFSPFIVDATVTLAKRSWRGVKITEAHREHYYQRAIQMGVSHRRVALFEYGFMLLVGTLAIWTRTQIFPWTVLLGCSVAYAIIMLQIDSRWAKLKRESA